MGGINCESASSKGGPSELQDEQKLRNSLRGRQHTDRVRTASRKKEEGVQQEPPKSRGTARRATVNNIVSQVKIVRGGIQRGSFDANEERIRTRPVRLTVGSKLIL